MCGNFFYNQCKKRIIGITIHKSSVVRLIPGVLGGAESASIESFSDGETLEFPQYTKPAEYRDMKVPDVLLSGHHGEIAKWRQDNSIQAER
jgi:tRNA (guanine37-N1)-methyltransferase